MRLEVETSLRFSPTALWKMLTQTIATLLLALGCFQEPVGSEPAWQTVPDSDRALPDWSAYADDEAVALGETAAVGDFDGDGFQDVAYGVRLRDSTWAVKVQRFGAKGFVAAKPAETNLGTFQIDGLQTYYPRADSKQALLLVHSRRGDYSDNRGVLRLLLPAGGIAGLTQPEWQLVGATGGSQFGRGLAVADFNGDGWNDVAVGAPYHRGAYPGSGRVLLFLGSPSGLEVQPAATLEGDSEEALFGITLAIADGDRKGQPALVVGAETWSAPRLKNCGLIESYVWDDAKKTLMLRKRIEGHIASMRLGRSLAGGWDLDGDGLADAVGGMPGFDSRGWRGRIMLVSETKQTNTLQDDIAGGTLSGLFGSAVAVLPNPAKDGLAWFAAGAYLKDGPFENAGMVAVYAGERGRVPLNHVWRVHGGEMGMQLGERLQGGFDVNGDGYGDVLIGSPKAAMPGGHRGKLELVLGSPSRFSGQQAWISTAGGGAWSRLESSQTITAISAVASNTFLTRTNTRNSSPDSAMASAMDAGRLGTMLAAFVAGLALLVFVFWRRTVGRARLVEAEAVEDARRRLAEDLHDGPGAELSGRALEEQMSLGSVTPETEGLAVHTRDMTWLFRPENDSFGAVADFFADQTQSMLEKAGGSVSLSLPEAHDPSRRTTIPQEERALLIELFRAVVSEGIGAVPEPNCRLALSLRRDAVELVLRLARNSAVATEISPSERILRLAEKARATFEYHGQAAGILELRLVVPISRG